MDLVIYLSLSSMHTRIMIPPPHYLSQTAECDICDKLHNNSAWSQERFEKKATKSNKLGNNSRRVCPERKEPRENVNVQDHRINLLPTIRLGRAGAGVLVTGPSSSSNVSAKSPTVDGGAEGNVPARAGRGVTRNPDSRLARVTGAGVSAEGLGICAAFTGLRDRARATVAEGDGARVSGTEDGARSEAAFRPRRLTAEARGNGVTGGAVEEEGKAGREDGPAREAAAELKTLGLGATAAGGKRR